MKTITASLLFTLLLALGLPGVSFSQENSDESSEKVRSILANPKLRNMLRSVKEDPEAVAQSIKEDPDDLVKSATALFQEQLQSKEKNESTGEVPATRSNKSTTDQALDKLTEMIPEAASKVNELSEDPSVRSAVQTVTNRVTPPAPEPAPAPAPDQVAADLPPVPEPPAAAAAVPADSLAIPASSAPPVPTIGNEAPAVPDSASLSGDDIPAPQPLQAKKASGSNQGASSDSPKNMEILARESVMDNKTGRLVFTGDVRVNHPEFIIKSDRLEIFMTAGQATGQSSGKSPFQKAIASGGMVEITRISPEGKTQIAMARRADYNAETQDIILSGGPPYMQDGKSFVKPDSDDAQIILRGNGKYEVKGSGRSTIVIPVKGGRSMTNGPGLGGSLGDFNQ